MDPDTLQNNINAVTPGGTITPNNPTSVANSLKPVQPKPQKSKALITTSIICAILAVAGIGFGVYGMLTANQKSAELAALQTEPAPELEQLSGTSSPAVSDASLPTPTEVAKLLEEKYDFKEEERLFCIGASSLVCGIDSFDMDAKLQYVIFHAPESMYNEELRSRYIENPMSYIQNINYDDLNSLFHDYFGSSEDIAKESRDFGDRSFLIKIEYLPDSDSFDIQFKDGLGGTTTISVFNKVASVSKTENGFVANIISVTINNVLSSTEEPLYGFYGDKQMYQMGMSDEVREEIKESLSSYNFGFVSEDGEYKLTSVEKVNN